ncbi:hypothetical protein CLCR_05306 [Cladophialophora carrionii]|uniref:Uncharacterized protein n=1 Tax=Cladophialophora carrionii TaxID=86049 RepID=A0A1C1CLM3_9EURO|nr:hypothetical protein CLCR_05306 [Cladophialophora carrionii]
MPNTFHSSHFTHLVLHTSQYLAPRALRIVQYWAHRPASRPRVRFAYKDVGGSSQEFEVDYADVEINININININISEIPD